MKKLLSLPPVSFGLETAELYLRVGAPRSAAALSYFLILTLFPLLMFVNYFIGLFHLDLEHLLESLDQLLPEGALLVMRDYLGYVADSQSGALLVAGLFTILISASAGLRTLLAVLDELHGRKNVHTLRRVALSVLLSVLFLLTIYLSVVVIFTGEWFFWLLEENLPRLIAEHIPLSALSSLWRWMRYLLLFCFVLLLVLIVYRAGTPRRAMRSWFIGMSSRYALVYGSLASLIILLVWLYLCGNILLLGAVVGRVLENRLKR